MQFILLILGFMLLIKGADMFVGGASSIARKFKVPAMIIGLTIVAMGTSAPEAAVSISSSLAGQNDMSIANVVGSNLFNILVVLGASAVLANLPVEENTKKKDGPFLTFTTILLMVMCLDGNLGRIDGIILLGVFTNFLISTVKTALQSVRSKNNGMSDGNEVAVAVETASEIEEVPMLKTIILSLIGAVGIVLGGDIVVDAASKIATSFGMSSNLVGLTIVAMGTSLPEFVTSMVAIKKGETDIAIGNVIGSNVFNILLVLGLASTISPIAVSTVALIDIACMSIITIVLHIFIKKGTVGKSKGIILLCTYLCYMGYTILR